MKILSNKKYKELKAEIRGLKNCNELLEKNLQKIETLEDHLRKAYTEGFSPDGGWELKIIMVRSGDPIPFIDNIRLIRHEIFDSEVYFFYETKRWNSKLTSSLKNPSTTTSSSPTISLSK